MGSSQMAGGVHDDGGLRPLQHGQGARRAHNAWQAPRFHARARPTLPAGAPCMVAQSPHACCVCACTPRPLPTRPRCTATAAPALPAHHPPCHHPDAPPACISPQVNMSVAVIPMAKDLGWSATDRGLVSSSFFWGYSLTQIPAGWISTRSALSWPGGA